MPPREALPFSCILSMQLTLTQKVTRAQWASRVPHVPPARLLIQPQALGCLGVAPSKAQRTRGQVPLPHVCTPGSTTCRHAASRRRRWFRDSASMCCTRSAYRSTWCCTAGVLPRHQAAAAARLRLHRPHCEHRRLIVPQHEHIEAEQVSAAGPEPVQDVVVQALVHAAHGQAPRLGRKVGDIEQQLQVRPHGAAAAQQRPWAGHAAAGYGVQHAVVEAGLHLLRRAMASAAARTSACPRQHAHAGRARAAWGAPAPTACGRSCRPQ